MLTEIHSLTGQNPGARRLAARLSPPQRWERLVGPLRASVPLVLEGYLEKTPDHEIPVVPARPFPGPASSGSLPSPARGSARAGWSLAGSSGPRSSKQMAWAWSGLFKTRWAREDGGGRAAGRGVIFTARREAGAPIAPHPPG